MRPAWRTMLAEERSRCQVPGWPWTPVLRVALLLLLTGTVMYSFFHCLRFAGQQQLDSAVRSGIYRLHIQVTLTNCSSTARPHSATLTVGICSPAAHSISLLRLHFDRSCSVASQRLTPLARGDVLCTNLTLPLLPSGNADETFFGVQWVHP
ncbi:CD70 antigen [Camelus ferus]|nr:CD70 antigen [Camelus ferus]